MSARRPSWQPATTWVSPGNHPRAVTAPAKAVDRSGWENLPAFQNNTRPLAATGQQMPRLLVGEARNPGRMPFQNPRRGTGRPLTAAIPHHEFLTTVGGEVAARMMPGQASHLGVVTRHGQFFPFTERQRPNLYAVLLSAGHHPASVRRNRQRNQTRLPRQLRRHAAGFRVIHTHPP